LNALFDDDETLEIYRPLVIVSGGQTGVDRAALDVAIELNIAHGGWCPRGRLAEDGRIDPKYQLTETTEATYPARTERNIIDSDATLILRGSQVSRGTALTIRLCREHGKPYLSVSLNRAKLAKIQDWLAQHRPARLNIAGPRESSQSGAYEQSKRILKAIFGASSNA
jgi:Circularly permutated YpsA SLOG family